MKKYYPVTLIFFLLTLFAGCKNNKSNKNDLDTATNSTSTYQNPEWADKLIEAYIAFNDSKNVQSANLVFNASEEMPIKNWENYFVCAMVYASNEELEKAYLSIDRAIEFGLKDTELLESIPEFNSLKNSPSWDTLVSKANQKSEEYLSNIQNPKLFKELEYLWSKDQQALSEYEQNISVLDSNATIKEYSKLFEPVENRWQINKVKLDSIIEIYGWPGNDLVGEDGAKIAWSIAQHHPDVFFKKKCLALIKQEVAKENINPNHYAELNDRIARDTWQKQTYGASMGKQEPHPIKDVSEVNKRRLKLGLPEPIEVYAFYHGINYKIPSEKEVEEKYRKAQSDYKKFESYINAKNTDSSIVYLRKAIKAYGDLSNEQLFQSAKKLAATEKENAQGLSIKILKVLIWREWENRFDIPKETQFRSLTNKNEWKEILELLEMSKN